MPLILLATIATIIASQSIITGAFSMTRQAIQLGWLPRLVIKQTSAEGYGQIYVGAVNWLLMIVTLGADARLRQVRQSRRGLRHRRLADHADDDACCSSSPCAKSGAGACSPPARWRLVFVIVDGGFFGANMAKVLDGGYVPLLLAGAVYGVMWIWHRGAVAVHKQVVARADADLGLRRRTAIRRASPRVPGSAVFLTRAKDDTPPVLAWHVRKNRSLHESVLTLTMTVVSTPRVDHGQAFDGDAGRRPISGAPRRCMGFMEQPNVPALLAQCHIIGAAIDLSDVTYYVGHETIVPREDGKGLPRWQEALFAAMGRNAARISDYLRLPYGRRRRDRARDRRDLSAIRICTTVKELRLCAANHAPSAGSQEYVGDPRNDDVLISVNGVLTPRPEAKVSVFDSGFVLGDGVWEGLRLNAGRIAFLDKHFDRLWDGAKMLRIDIGLSREALDRAPVRRDRGQRMRDGVHIRLMVTRGVKRSPYQDPRLTIGGATIVIIPEWKCRAPRCWRAASTCSPCMCGAPGRPSRTRSSIRIPSSTASSPASRRWRRARTRR